MPDCVSLKDLNETDYKKIYQTRRKQIRLEELKINVFGFGEIKEDILHNPPMEAFRLIRLKKMSLQVGSNTGW